MSNLLKFILYPILGFSILERIPILNTASDALASESTPLHTHFSYMNALSGIEPYCAVLNSYFNQNNSLDLCTAEAILSSTQQNMCLNHRRILNMLNWESESPGVDDLTAVPGIRLDLRRALGSLIKPEQELSSLRMQAISKQTSVAKFFSVEPQDGIPKTFVFQNEVGFDLSSVVHACDWLKGDLKISIDIEIEDAPDSLSPAQLQRIFESYIAAKFVKTSLAEGALKTLFQAFLLLRDLPVELEQAIGPKDKLVEFFFDSNGQAAELIEFSSVDDLQKRIANRAVSRKHLQTFEVVPQL